MGFLLYHVKNMREEGLAHSRTALRLFPDDVRAHCDLGVALFDEGQFQQAISHLSRALSLMPGQPDLEPKYNAADIHCILGLSLLPSRQLKEATGHLSYAIRRNSGDARAYQGLRIAYDLARAAGQESLAKEISGWIRLYKAQTAPETPSNPR